VTYSVVTLVLVVVVAVVRYGDSAGNTVEDN